MQMSCRSATLVSSWTGPLRYHNHCRSPSLQSRRGRSVVVASATAPKLRNEYWLLRHGKSKANELGIIVSRPENGVKDDYSLAGQGKQQADEAGQSLASNLENVDEKGVFIYCSPFSRTVETAAIAGRRLGIEQGSAQFQVAEELRERSFGDLELQSHEHYVPVWTADASSADHQPPGAGESVAQVATRAQALCNRLEQRHDGCNIVLVSHGDTLSILWAVFTGGSLLENRQHGLVTGELRRLDPSATASRTLEDLG